MTQVASTESVLAPFQGEQFTSRGRSYTMSREDEKFFVTMADPDWEAGAQANGVNLATVNPPIVKLQVIMTTGSHHMQGYWVPSNKPNMLRQVPMVWLIGDQRWVPREDIFIEPPDAPRHLIVWNDNCIVCHAVDGTPNFDVRTLTVNTEVAELGIACEACHGPGESHIAFHQKAIDEPLNALSESHVDAESAVLRTAAAANALAAAKDPIVNPGTCDPKTSSEICGQCHSYFLPHDSERFGEEGYSYVAGGDLDASHAMVSYDIAKKYENEVAMSVFWNDGTCRVSGREFTAMRDSGCFLNGSMSCVSCHSMHNSDPVNQLAAQMETNQSCLQCHTDLADRVEEHTHHPLQSSGSQCVNCHMPYTTYGLLKALRSHRIQSPRIAGKEDSDQPGACNLCHLDQTRAWSAEKLSQWYDQPAANLSKDDRETSAAVLWLLRGDAVQRSISAWHMNWVPALEVSGSQWQAPLLAQLLDDDYSAVRYLVAKALEKYPEFEPTQYDYIAPPLERTTAKQKFLDLWQATQRPRPAEQASQVLMNADNGEILTDAVREYLRQQNKRPIVLPE